MVAMSSCTEDYNADVAAPQSWEQEELTDIPDFSLTAAPDINLETNTAETVQFVTYQASELADGAKLGDVIIEVASTEDGAKTAITHTEGAIAAESLQKMIEGYFGKAAELRTLYVSAYTTANFEGQASCLVADAVTVNVMPKTPIIVPEYYLVGGLQGWDPANRAASFYPIDAAAGTLSYTTDFSAYPDGTVGNAPNFKIFAADQMGSWDNGNYGTAIDGDTSLTGTIVALGGAIMCPTNEIYTLNIDMINNTYEMILAEDQAPATYSAVGLVGLFNGWNADAALTEVTPHNWYLEGFVHEAAGELKFRADGKWDISWGSGTDVGDVNYGVAYINGGNMVVPAGTYNVYFNDITGQFYFITVE